MAKTYVHTLHELFEQSTQALQHAHDAHKPAFLVVPSHNWAQTRKLALRHIIPIGVDVLTHSQLVTQLWELFGNGTSIISTQERSVLLRPLVNQVGLLESEPSPGFIKQLSAFVEEAISPNLTPQESLSSSQSKVMELVSLYEAKLAQEGLVELAQAEYALINNASCFGMHFVFEKPDLHSAHIRGFIAGLEAMASVTVLEQRLHIQQDPTLGTDELLNLRNYLFTGKGGLQAQGKVRVGVAHGSHAGPSVIAGLIQELHNQDGLEYKDIVLGYANPAQAYPQLHNALAQANIPFVTQFTILCAGTGLGAAFCALEDISNPKDDESAYLAMLELISSPYCGVSSQDARALQMRWREQSHSTHEQRLKDLRNGFEQGNATATLAQQKFQSVVELLEAPRSERVSMLFNNAQGAHLDANTLIDDRTAADALLDYLEICKRFSTAPNATEMANLSIALNRSYGNSSNALQITSVANHMPQQTQATILCNLDTQHYPMAIQAGPFDDLMSKLGIKRADTLAQDQRIMLLNTIELSHNFAFERETHNAAGDESCQSALFEELVAVYRSPQEDAESLAVQAVPKALRPFELSLSEADVFFAEGEGSFIDKSAMRGALQDPQDANKLLHNHNQQPLVLSPTALEDYYRCPYRWFTSRRVGYNGMDVQFDVAAQGSLVHSALERFYREFKAAGNERVTPSNLSLALEFATRAFEAQLEHDRAKDRRGIYLRSKTHELKCQELLLNIHELISRDAYFLPGFIPTYFELELGRSSGQLLQYAGVPVSGKVDRIDVDAQGNAIIIDYKLSTLSVGYGFGKDDELPQRIQTDIYATLVQRHFELLGTPLHVIGSVYRSYKKDVLRGVYERNINWGELEQTSPDNDALPHKNSEETYSQYLLRIEDVVTTCMQHLQAGNIEPNPIAPDACEYCKAQLFCPKGGKSCR